MGKITEIKKLKRLYKLSLDGFDERDTLYVCEDSIIHFMLSKDKLLSETDLTELSNFDQFAQGKSLAIYYLSFKARTAHEVKKYLREHDISESQIENILTSLSKNNLINDRHYAENFIQGKLSMASAGPFLIKQKLREKGISSVLIDEELSNVYNEEQQIEIALKLAEKFTRSKGSNYSFNQLKQKIIQFLTGKGFDYTISKIALDELNLRADAENEHDLLYSELDKAFQKYGHRYDGYDLRRHITQSLARKGFNFDEIAAALRDGNFND